MATVIPTTEQLAQQVELIEHLIALESSQSLADYLCHVVIDSRPPKSWGQVVEPWQEQIVAPLIPAIESMSGLRSDYDGPRSFFFVLPKGHDKTGMIARLANWAVAFSRHRIEGIAAASTLEQAAVLLDSMKAELALNPWLKRIIETQHKRVLGPGGMLKVISADAPHASGPKPDLIICDELTFWESPDLWEMLYGASAKRTECIVIIITNAGLRGSWQWDLLNKAKADHVNWHVYESPPGVQLASWMSSERVEAIREVIGKGHAKRVLENRWIDATETPLLPFDLILTCVDESCLWPTWEVPPGERPELYIGVDVGRTDDRTVIWTLERVGDLAITREVKVLHKTSFAEQKAEIRKRVNRFVIALRIDKGTIGYQMAEELEREFHGIAEGVALGSPKQGQLAQAMKTAFESRRIRVPNDADMISDFQLIDEVDTGAAGVPTLKTNKGDTGHGDRFWAAALALYGMPFQTAKTFVSRRSIGVVR